MPTFSRSLVCAAALVTLGTAVVGCQKSSTAAREDLAKAANATAVGEADKALTTLQPYSASSSGNGEATILAKSLRGHAKYDQAMGRMAELVGVYAEIARIDSEISQVAGFVSTGNTLVANYKLLDPSAARAEIKAAIAEAQGGAGKATWKGADQVEVPTLAAGKERADKLGAQIAAKQDELRKHEADREAALKRANELANAIDGKAGRESVDAFAKASEARKEIAGISNSIDVAQNDLTLLNGELAVVQGQIAVVEQYVATLKGKDAALAGGYEAVTKGSAGVSQVSTNAVSGTEKGVASLNAKADELAAATKKAGELYDETLKLLEESDSEYSAAITEAQAFRTDLTGSGKAPRSNSDVVAMANEASLQFLGVAQFTSEKAQALTEKARLEGYKAVMLAERAAAGTRVAAALQKAGLAVPASVTVKAEDASAAKELANKGFKEADGQFDNAYSSIQAGGRGSLLETRQLSIAVARMFANYAWYQFLMATGDEKGAATALINAQAERDKAKDNQNFKMPTLPPELVIVVPVTPAPTTAPTTEPAEGATPSTNPTTVP